MKKMITVLAVFTALCVFVTGCEKKPSIEGEKFVSVHYRGTLEDGSEFDSSEGREPLEFIYGVGMMIPGFEKGIAGLHVGDKKTFLVKADDAYPYDERRVERIPLEMVPPEIAPEVGMQLYITLPTGPVPVIVKEITATEIVLDANNPLAGKDLTFDVEIMEIRDPTEEELLPLRAAQETTPLPSGELPPLPNLPPPAGQ
jgi:peptidylprolyl isomerase